jgi:hypothetical protein
MTSGCTVRIPYFTVASNSVDRLMRLRAGSTAKNPACDQADSARRPLRRRLDTMERPARVRIRKRKPCTRARRRLFGWKVRLPLATAFSSLCLALPSGRSRFSTELIRGSVGAGLAAGRRGPQVYQPRSQPYRRLSGDCLRVLTRLGWVKPGLAQRPRPNIVKTFVFARSLTRRRHHNRDKSKHAPKNFKEPDWNATERLAAARKTVSFGQCRFRLERRVTTKRGWRID